MWAWVIWVILAGRGFGKTRTGAEWIRGKVESGESKRITLIAATSADARDVMLEGESGLLTISPPWFKPHYEPSKRRLTWPNGAVATILSADRPDRLRGPQCFVAGTLVETEAGPRPIEAIAVGDLVVTRHGLRPVVATGSNDAEVGVVSFSNGASLTGTADHPVLSCEQWVPLGKLTKGLRVFVGALERTDTSSATRTVATTSNTGSSGSRNSGRSRLVGTSITRTATGRTTRSRTSSACHPERTTTGTSSHERCSTSIVRTAASHSPGSGAASHRRALRANRSARTRPEGAPGSASTAGESSCQGADGTAVSVASTWEHVGVRRVFNLTVEGLPEYFANGILVHNCDTFWADEVAAWRFQEAWTQLQFGFRLGTNPQGIVTKTPRPIATIKKLVKRAGADVALTKGSTYENRSNLAKPFFASILTEYEGTRLGRQEIDAEILEDNPNALWQRTRIDDLRLRVNDDGSYSPALPPMRRVVVAIDPAVSTNPKSNETGIIVVGLGEDGHAYVLDDLSGVFSPAQWAARALEAFDRWEADYIIGEVNNGGDLVERNVQAERQGVPFKAVHASRGKATRADPISTLYEKGRVHHVGTLPKLEDQQCGWDPANDETSPDRVDALVWGITALDLNKKLQDYDGLRRGRPSSRSARGGSRR